MGTFPAFAAALFLTINSLALFPSVAYAGITRRYTFDVTLQNVTRLCHTKTVVTVNGRFPGQPLVVREGDRLLVKVVNHVKNNVTFHWHGVRQLRSGWADGPEYITQCPIQTGNSYVYNFTFTGQRGTLWWHAHSSWLRATMYGPLVILPKRHEPYPFPKPHKEVTIMFGEWWNADTEAVIKQALRSGGGPNVSDAYTFNGLPGPLYNCSAPNDSYVLMVKPGKTYLLRLINAALNDDLFFSIANHSLTVVEVDAVYTKPYTTNTLLIAPGQTTNVLLKTKPITPTPTTTTTFLMAVRPYFTGSGTFDNTTAAAILEYQVPSKTTRLPKTTTNTSQLPPLPTINDTSSAAKFSTSLRSLANARFPANVPRTVDRFFFFTVGLGTNPCPKNQTCQGPTNTTKFAASINNVTFVPPKTAILQTFYYSSRGNKNNNNGVYRTDYPSYPIIPFNYTGTPPNNTNVMNDGSTKVAVLPYNASVEVVLQDTSIVTAESHPLHLHGYNFFIVGQGFGNFNANKDPANYNLVDPVERNTAPVPSGGWVAIRFRADNPGAWFMHCHFDVHLSWGLRMVWIVEQGKKPNEKLLPPPLDLPKC